LQGKESKLFNYFYLLRDERLVLAFRTTFVELCMELFKMLMMSIIFSKEISIWKLSGWLGSVYLANCYGKEHEELLKRFPVSLPRNKLRVWLIHRDGFDGRNKAAHSKLASRNFKSYSLSVKEHIVVGVEWEWEEKLK
jgi:hypothetical protein